MTHKDTHLWNTYNLVNQWISHADGKVAAVLAGIGVFAGFIIANIKPISGFLTDNGLVWSGIFIALLIFISTISAFSGILPKLKVGAPKSVLFFNHISQHENVVDYQEKLAPVLDEPEKFTSALIHQIWANSRVATKKYYCIGVAIWSLALAIFISFIPITVYIYKLL